MSDDGFNRYLFYSADYEAAVHANGNVMWWELPERRAEVARRLGLPEDTDPMALRRALWERSR